MQSKVILAFIALIAFDVPLCHAQQYYWGCQVDIPYAGDPIKNGYAKLPSHTYFSEIFPADPNSSKEPNQSAFFAWVKKQYSKSWKWDGYRNSYDENVKCDTYRSVEGWTGWMDWWAENQDNVVITRTTWPGAQ